MRLTYALLASAAAAALLGGAALAVIDTPEVSWDARKSLHEGGSHRGAGHAGPPRATGVTSSGI